MLGRNEIDMVKNVHWSACKFPFFFSRTLIKLGFSGHGFEKYSNMIFHENPSGGPRRSMTGTDRMKLIAAFRNFAKRA